MTTPWGKIQQVTTIMRGAAFVSTAGHGGLRLSAKIAEKLSPHARSCGERYGSYLYFEEDCAWAVPLFELPDVLDAFCFAMGKTKEETTKAIKGTLESYFVPYCLEREIQISRESYRRHEIEILNAERRARRDPNLIISAVRVAPGAVQVHTADGLTHLVTDESYSEAYATGEFNLSDTVLFVG